MTAVPTPLLWCLGTEGALSPVAVEDGACDIALEAMAIDGNGLVDEEVAEVLDGRAETGVVPVDEDDLTRRGAQGVLKEDVGVDKGPRDIVEVG